MPPALVAPLGVSNPAPRSAETKRVQLPGRPYFVMLGTIEGRKNHLLMLNIWSEMARRLGTDCPRLVVIGQRGWESEQAVDMLDRSDEIRGHVIELSRCDDAQLNAYMANARALLFPSFVEGYGLPLVEALGAGTPVIASNLNVFLELAGDIPEYLSPIDGLGWSQMIEAYAPDRQPGAGRADRAHGRLARAALGGSFRAGRPLAGSVRLGAQPCAAINAGRQWLIRSPTRRSRADSTRVSVADWLAMPP